MGRETDAGRPRLAHRRVAQQAAPNRQFPGPACARRFQAAVVSPGGEGRKIIEIHTIHHVSIPVTDLERSRAFYGDVLGLNEIQRPPSDIPGAWYRLGDRELHLIAGNHATFREGKAVDDQDIHFALRVASYRETRRLLLSKGFHPEADDELKRMKESPGGAGASPRLHIMDPDRNVIELNAERLDEDRTL